MAAIDGMYEMQVYQSGRRGQAKQIFFYIFEKSNNSKDARLAYLKGEKVKFDLCWIFTKEFKWEDRSFNALNIILETAEYSPYTKKIDRRKVDGMSFGEKKVFSIPNNATFLKAIIIDEDNRLLLNESLHDNFSQLDSSRESRPGVERDDTIEPVHQYMCMMLIVYTLYISFTMQQLYL